PPLYPLSLHDALPISTSSAAGTAARDDEPGSGGVGGPTSTSGLFASRSRRLLPPSRHDRFRRTDRARRLHAARSRRDPALDRARDRKSTRLNSSHDQI